MEAAPLRPSSSHWPRPVQIPTNGPLSQNERAADGSLSMSISDPTQIKREVSEYDHKHSASTNGIGSVPVSAIQSPRALYAAPPPPYTYTPTAPGANSLPGGYISPPESRRTSDDDKEPKRSLPSISEALGKAHDSLFSPGPPPTQAHSHTPISSAPVASSPTIHRTFPDSVHSGPPNPFAAIQGMSNFGSEAEGRPQHPLRRESHNEEIRTSNQRISTVDSASVSAHTTSTSSPLLRQSPHTIYPHSQSSPMYPPTSAPVPAPGYRTYAPTSFSFPPPPPPPASAFPTYQHAYSGPSNQWRSDGSEINRADEVRKAASKRSPGAGHHYGESVKRHLDTFEFETSLNEVRYDHAASIF